MKKRILVTHWSMVVGGIETALINLLKRLDPDKYDVDLLLEEKTGEFLGRVPGFVNVTDVTSIGITLGLKKTALRELKSFRLGSACKVVYYKLKNDVRCYDACCRNVAALWYDVAICFSQSPLLMKLVSDYVSSPLKMFFMHNELFVDEKKKGGNGFSNMADRGKLFGNFDYLFGVSDAIRDKMKELFPQYAEKCRTLYNFFDVGEILEKADESAATEMEESGGEIKILSVGRFTPEKNFSVIPSACELLLDRGLDVKWFVIGDGNERARTQKLIEEKHLEDRVFLLGTKTNPYPYFKACDIYCQPSLAEAYCITVGEARIFGKPIVATDFSGIREQLSGGEGGKIVGADPRSIADGIAGIAAMPAGERDKMLALSAYPNRGERDAVKVFFDILDRAE